MDVVRARRVARAALPGLILAPLLVLGSRGAAAEQVPPHHALNALAYVLLIASVAGVVLAPLLPRAVVLGEAALLICWLVADYPHGPVYVPVLLAVAVLASARPLRSAVVVASAAAGSLGVAQLLTRSDGWLSRLVVAVGQVGIVGLAFAFGLLVRRARAAGERARLEAGRRAVEHERLEIAREVHDVVGHGLAVIALQAGVALHVVDRRPDQARLALEAIRRTSADALDELRTTLAVFRHDGEAPALAPTAGLTRLPALVAELRAAGLAVAVEMGSELPAAVPPAVTRVAYRVVQEATTNVLRHAGSPTAAVRVDRADGTLTVTVENPAGPVAVERADAGGTGLVGLRERAEALGGTLAAGPTAAGGWLVSAVLPLPDEVPDEVPAGLLGEVPSEVPGELPGELPTEVPGELPAGTDRFSGATPPGTA